MSHPQFPVRLVVDSAKSDETHVNTGNDIFYFSYKLAQHTSAGGEPLYARIITPKKSHLHAYFADFAVNSEYNGGLEPFLGCNGQAYPNLWIPVITTYIPRCGFLWAVKLKPGPVSKDHFVIIEFASKSWLTQLPQNE